LHKGENRGKGREKMKGLNYQNGAHPVKGVETGNEHKETRESYVSACHVAASRGGRGAGT